MEEETEKYNWKKLFDHVDFWTKYVNVKRDYHICLGTLRYGLITQKMPQTLLGCLSNFGVDPFQPTMLSFYSPENQYFTGQKQPPEVLYKKRCS